MAWTRTLGLGWVLLCFVKPSQPHSGPDWIERLHPGVCPRNTQLYRFLSADEDGCGNRRLFGYCMQRILVLGRRKGRGVRVQCGRSAGLVWLSGLTATASPVLLVRFSPTKFVSCSQVRRGEDAVKQRMMGSTCIAALKMRPLSQVKLPSPLGA